MTRGLRWQPLPRRKATQAAAAAVPEPPTNVHLVWPDGHKQPLDTVYAGTDADGIHRWRAVVAVPLDRAKVVLGVDVLPARTAIELHVADGDDGRFLS